MTAIREPQTRRGTTTLVESVTASWSLLAAAAGLWFLLDPAAYPLGAADPSPDFSLLAAVPVPVVSTTLLVLGPVGLAAAAMMAQPASVPVVRRTLLTASFGQAAIFGLLVPDIRLLIAMGYLCAVLGPILVVALLAAGTRRNPRNVVALALVGLGAAASGWAFDIGPGTLAGLGRSLGAGVADFAPVMFTMVGSFVGGVLWTLTSARYLRRGADGSGPASRWVPAPTRWGRWVTVGAALCPLPYALLRMTWLTPWPQFAPFGMTPEMRIFGLSLGFAALGGSVLTLGLISGWGERFPRWLPVLGGRPVPAVPPTGVALVVAAALTIAGRSLVQQLVVSDAGFGELGGEALLVFPFPVWGPLLAAAAGAYYLRRTGRLSRSR